MSDQVKICVFQLPKVGSFPGKFLHAVLAENAQPRVVCLPNRGRGKGFAHSHEPDLIGIASDARGSGVDALTDARDVFGDQEPSYPFFHARRPRNASSPATMMPSQLACIMMGMPFTAMCTCMTMRST